MIIDGLSIRDKNEVLFYITKCPSSDLHILEESLLKKPNNQNIEQKFQYQTQIHNSCISYYTFFNDIRVALLSFQQDPVIVFHLKKLYQFVQQVPLKDKKKTPFIFLALYQFLLTEELSTKQIDYIKSSQEIQIIQNKTIYFNDQSFIDSQIPPQNHSINIQEQQLLQNQNFVFLKQSKYHQKIQHLVNFFNEQAHSIPKNPFQNNFQLQKQFCQNISQNNKLKDSLKNQHVIQEQQIIETIRDQSNPNLLDLDDFLTSPPRTIHSQTLTLTFQSTKLTSLTIKGQIQMQQIKQPVQYTLPQSFLDQSLIKYKTIQHPIKQNGLFLSYWLNPNIIKVVPLLIQKKQNGFNYYANKKIDTIYFLLIETDQGVFNLQEKEGHVPGQKILKCTFQLKGNLLGDVQVPVFGTVSDEIQYYEYYCQFDD